jgi:hypothetical protein
MLIVRPLTNVFDQSFDVAATWRDDPDMPVNGGIIFVKRERLLKGKTQLLLRVRVLLLVLLKRRNLLYGA